MSVEAAELSQPLGGVRGQWLNNPRWDLMFLIFSAALVPFPWVTAWVIGQLTGNPQLATSWVNYIVAAIVGGPHMYATYTLTYMDKNWRKRYAPLAAIGALLPVLVIVLALTNLRLLLTIFFFWASVHVLHQITYLVTCYRNREAKPVPLKWRLVDYALVFSSLYPVATYKLTHDQFNISGMVLVIPQFLKADWVWISVCVLFATFLFLFLYKTWTEVKAGTVNWGATLLILVTVCIAVPLPAAQNMDVAFQGFNTWHSFQYLFLVYLIHRVRKQRGETSAAIVEKISGEGRGLVFYAFNVGLTLAAGAAVYVLHLVTGLDTTKCYYIVVLSFLLLHYFTDHILFFRFDAVDSPMPARRQVRAAA